MPEVGEVRLDYPGLVPDHLPSGKTRWRVRVEGNSRKRIRIPVGPEHPEFHLHYTAARAGETLGPVEVGKNRPDRGTLGWLAHAYLAHLERQVEAGAASPLTLKERRNLVKFVLNQRSEQPRSEGKLYNGLPMVIPEVELIAFKDRMARTPGKARNVWKLLRAMYDFGVERKHCATNPAKAVARPAYKSQGGAVPWTVADLEKYRRAHPEGTMAHLALSLFMFTACRIGDAIWLGPPQEEIHDGLPWLAWQPTKKDSKFVRIPMLAPLERAIKAQKVRGASTYLLTEHGKPFRSPEGLRNRLAKWCAAAGIEGRSSHGIRKAAGHLMALHGATQYEIMAVHGHANAATSQVYTETVERMRLGGMAAARLEKMEW